MEIVVRQCQFLDNKEIFNCESTFESIEDLKDVIAEIIENWSNMHGSYSMISYPKRLNVGSRIVLRCSANNDIETFEIKDVILAERCYFI